MYYEEKYENDLWYWRGTPDGAWIEIGTRMLSEKLAAAQRELAAWKQAVYSFERGEYPGADSGIADHVAELLAQEGGT